MLTATTTSLVSGTLFANVLSALALAVSLLALVWNMVRDLVTDRVKLDVQATVGGTLRYADGSSRAFFRDADATYIPLKPQVVVSITNVGRRPIVVSKIHGSYKNGAVGKTKFIFGAEHLPKALQPYETLMEVMNDSNFIADIQNDLVENIYAQDTKGHSWPLSAKSLSRLKRTATLVPKQSSKIR